MSNHLGLFNSGIFNKPIFNTKFIDPPGYTAPSLKRKPKKRKMMATSILRVRGTTSVHPSFGIIGRISTEMYSNVMSKISFVDETKRIASRTAVIAIQEVKAIVSRDYSIPLKGRLNIMELNSNKLVKHNTIQNILSLLDEE